MKSHITNFADECLFTWFACLAQSMASQQDEAVVVKVGSKQFRRPAVHSAQQFGVDSKSEVHKAARQRAEASPGSAATKSKSQTGAIASRKQAQQAAAGSPGYV